MENIFDESVSHKIIERIEALSQKTQPFWGKMAVEEMLAHCNVTYEFVYENKHTKPKGFKKWLLKMFVKNQVVNEKPYKKNSPTAPEFLIRKKRVFEIEKKRLIGYIQKTQELGAEYFHGRESHSFGKLSKSEWNNMFYKHLDHHLNQFGV